jgi:ankyrin repeat protein
MWAAWHNEVPAMRALVEAGAKVDATDRYGQSALSLAAENSNGAQEQAISLLLDSGADPSVCGYEGKTPAEWAEETVRCDIAALASSAVPLRPNQAALLRGMQISRSSCAGHQRDMHAGLHR